MDKNKHSILIVDDEKTNIIALTHILGSEYTIYAVKDGKNAISTAEEFMPDVILLDILMPDMDGYEVIAALKSSPKTKYIPVIFISGLSTVENEEKGLASGAVDYIIKPFSPAIVKLRLRNQIKMLEQLRSIEQLSVEAQAAARSKSAFLAMMSHEIRTPMNAIWGITEILMNSETLPSEVEEGLNKIHNSCDLLLGLINDILDFSKIDAGKLDINPAQYSIVSLINDSVQLNLMRIDSKPIEFVLNIDENLPAKLIGDELRIKQILNNILSNAFKYTLSGKVNLTVTSEFAPVKDTVILTLCVQDTGQGMTKEQVDSLFVEYSRFNQGRNYTVEGTGLGLVITQRLLKLMNGDISVESEYGKGSMFTVRLPQEKLDDEVIGKELAESLQQFQNYNSSRKRSQIVRDPMPYGSVLVVDDVETNLDVAVGLMKPYKLQIETVMSGFETIDRIKNGKEYDIIFMDHMMPEMDGIEATKQLRNMDYQKPIVVLTANAVAGQAEMFLKNGFDAFISKPIDVRQLNAVLNKFVRDKQPIEIIEEARHQQGANGIVETAEEPQMNTLLLESFLRDAHKAAAAFEELLKNRGLETESGLHRFTIMTHGMKSSLGNIGEAVLSDAAYNLEKAGKAKNSTYVKKELPEFLDRLHALLKKLEASKESNEEDSDGIDTPDLQEKLLAVQEACADYNRKGTLDILAEIKNCSKETKKVLEEIKEYILHSDFEEAESTAAAYIDILKGK